MATFGQRYGLIAFGAAQSTVRRRDTSGRYATQDLSKVNAQIARGFQAELVQSVQHMQMQRPNVSTGRLAKAMAMADNRFSNGTGWGVINPAALDAGIARYWRTIEEGSRATWRRGGMAGMEIYGVWGANIQGYYVSQRWGLTPKAVGPWRHLAEGGKLRGVRAQVAKKRGMKPMIVRNEIQPHRYIEDAVERFDPVHVWSSRVQRILRQTVHSALRGE